MLSASSQRNGGKNSAELLHQYFASPDDYEISRESIEAIEEKLKSIPKSINKRESPYKFNAVSKLLNVQESQAKAMELEDQIKQKVSSIDTPIYHRPTVKPGFSRKQFAFRKTKSVKLPPASANASRVRKEMFDKKLTNVLVIDESSQFSL